MSALKNKEKHNTNTTGYYRLLLQPLPWILKSHSTLSPWFNCGNRVVKLWQLVTEYDLMVTFPTISSKILIKRHLCLQPISYLSKFLAPVGLIPFVSGCDSLKILQPFPWTSSKRRLGYLIFCFLFTFTIQTKACRGFCMTNSFEIFGILSPGFCIFNCS